MANRDSHEWIFTPEEAGLFRGAYDVNFGNVAVAALMQRRIDNSKSPRKRAHIVVGGEGEIPVIFPDKLVDSLLEELDGPVHDNPDQFKNGEELMHLVNDCKQVLLDLEALKAVEE